MPLNDGDRAWIREEIGKATGGWMPPWLKQSLALILVLGAGGFILRDYIPDKMVSATSDMRSTLGSVSADVASLKADVGQLKTDFKDMLNKAFQRAYPAANTPGGPKPPTKERASNFFERGSAIIEMANSLGVGLDPDVTNRFGLDAIAASENVTLRDQAWKASGLSLHQRSKQQELQALIESKNWIQPRGPQEIIEALSRFLPGTKTYVSEMMAPRGRYWLAVVIGHEAQIESVLPTSYEYGRLVGTGYQFTPPLDGHHFRNVIFENLNIVYHGGPLILENVSFINCQFEFSPSPNARNIAALIFSNKQVTFEKPS